METTQQPAINVFLWSWSIPVIFFPLHFFISSMLSVFDTSPDLSIVVINWLASAFLVGFILDRRYHVHQKILMVIASITSLNMFLLSFAALLATDQSLISSALRGFAGALLLFLLTSIAAIAASVVARTSES